MKTVKSASLRTIQNTAKASFLQRESGMPKAWGRTVLLGSVAAVALWGSNAERAEAQACTLVGAVTTCTGAFPAADSVITGTTVTGLTVENVTANIGQVSLTNTAGTAIVNSNTGTFAIAVMTDNTSGIVANAAGGTNAATVTSVGNIMTMGATDSFGISAISAGGVASATSTGDISTTGTDSSGINIAGVGGTVSSTGTITTAGDGSRGITVTSTGTGNVTVTSTGAITTTGTGANSDGIWARAATGGVEVTSSGAISTVGSTSRGIYANVTVAGQTVEVTSIGNITTTGATSRGIEATALNGAVTVNSTGDIMTTTDSSDAIFADGGVAGNVVVMSSGALTTAGATARGINAEADGAGTLTITSAGNITTAGTDGEGVLAVTDSGALTLTSTGNVTTAGATANGFAVTTTTGVIDFTSTGNITTTGATSRGISTIGTTSNVTTRSTGDIMTMTDDSDGIFAGATTGAIVVMSSGTITTVGADAEGIRAEATTGEITVTSTGNVTTGGDNAEAIRAVNTGAGAVTVTSTGDIVTAGATDSQGIIVNGGTGGAVAVTSTGDITTAGTTSEGISAVSTGTATGNTVTITSTGNVSTVDSNGLSASTANGTASITSTGDVTATGANVNGIVAASSAGSAEVTIVSGTVNGGSGTGSGVVLTAVAAGTGTLTNGGTIRALSGIAITGSDAIDTVTNNGTVIGNVDLGALANVFNNNAGATFETGTVIDLGTGTLTNSGILTIGGTPTIVTAALTGNFTQTSTGVLAIDLDEGLNTTDVLNVSGDAMLDGVVLPTLTNITTGTGSFTFLNTTGTQSGTFSVADTGAVDYTLTHNANDVVLGYVVNLAPTGLGLTPNERAIGAYLQRAFGLGSGTLGPLITALGNLNPADYEAALNRLQPEHFSAAGAASWASFTNFAQRAGGCGFSGGCRLPVVGESLLTGYAPFSGNQAEANQRGRLGLSVRTTSQDSQGNNVGGDGRTVEFSGGFVTRLSDDNLLSFNLAYQNSSYDGNNSAESDGYGFFGSASFTNRAAFGLETSLSFSAGFAQLDAERNVGIGAIGTVRSDQDLSFLGLNLDLAKRIGLSGSSYLRPAINIGINRVKLGEVNEGTSPGAVNIASTSENVFSASPSIEYGGDLGTDVQYFGRLGVTLESNDEITRTATLVGAPAGAGNFNVLFEQPSTTLDISIGLSSEFSEGFVGEIQYDGNFGSGFQGHRASVQVSRTF